MSVLSQNELIEIPKLEFVWRSKGWFGKYEEHWNEDGTVVLDTTHIVGITKVEDGVFRVLLPIEPLIFTNDKGRETYLKAKRHPKRQTTYLVEPHK